MREKIDPGNPNEDNLYELSEAAREGRGIQFLPQTLQEAVEAFAADPLIEATLGKGLRDEFIRYRDGGMERVPPHDFAMGSGKVFALVLAERGDPSPASMLGLPNMDVSK